MLRKLRKKYVWLPLVLAIYAAFMAWFNRETVTVHHEYTQYFSTLAVEAVVLVLLAIFLKKRDTLRRQREEGIRK